MLVLAIPLLLAGLLQLVFAALTIAHRGDLKTTQARQLVSVLGLPGTVAFFVILGVLLIAGGLYAYFRVS